jgi:hypothetical protein
MSAIIFVTVQNSTYTKTACFDGYKYLNRRIEKWDYSRKKNVLYAAVRPDS